MYTATNTAAATGTVTTGTTVLLPLLLRHFYLDLVVFLYYYKVLKVSCAVSLCFVYLQSPIQLLIGVPKHSGKLGAL